MEKRKSIFSVVIPLYNKEAYIAETIGSVLNQTLCDFELIIVNDGSTDKSLDVVSGFLDNRIKVFSCKNGGVSRARNFGVAHAQGEYIAFLDADDLWDANYLSEMKHFIERFSGCGLYMSAHRVIERSNVFTPCTHVPEGIIDDYFKCELTHLITRPSATIVRAEVFERVGGFPSGMVSGEDSYFCAKVASDYEVGFNPKALVSYNKMFSGMSIRCWQVDSCKESWLDLYREGNYYRNEFVASKAIRAAKRFALGFQKEKSTELEQQTQYTRQFKGKWFYLFLLNRIPNRGLILYKNLKPIYSHIKVSISTAWESLFSLFRR